MQFDETQYIEDFVKKHRGARTAPGDLMSRYAIELPATDAEISAKVRAVRAYWDTASQGNSMAAQIARMCRAEDQRLCAKHGAALETSAWWQQQQSARQSAAEASIERAAASLREYYGPLGVVTRGTLDKSAATLKITPRQAAHAVRLAGLRVLPRVSVPDGEPISDFSALLKNMAECGAASVPDLVHPDAGPFSIIDGYVSRDDPRRRLDEEAVAAQIDQAGKNGISTADNARMAALHILRLAFQGGADPRDVALYHLITIARASASMHAAMEELQKTGLHPDHAERIAVLATEEKAVADLSRAVKAATSPATSAPLAATGDRHEPTPPDGVEVRPTLRQIGATPRAKARPVGELQTRNVENDTGVRVRIWWTPADASEVRIIRSDAGHTWPFGAVISPEALAGAGQEVTGDVLQGQPDSGFETALPPGLHHLLPISDGGTGFVVGRGAKVAVIDPVRQLTIAPFATYATVTWEWPSGAQFAELNWRLGDKAGSVRIDQEQYASGGGVQVPLGDGPCAIDVRGMIVDGGVSFDSSAVHAVITATIDPVITYDVSDVRRSGGRRKRVTFNCETPCRNVVIQMVVSAGPVIPTSPNNGDRILHTTLALEPGVPAGKIVTIPPTITKPFWVRCFVLQGRARLVDPPVSHLKET